MNKILVLLHGVSGSGKSTLAKQLAEENSGVIFSTDNHFMVDGEYRFNVSKLSENHKKTFNQVREAMENSQPYILLDNTNLNGFECIQYRELAHSLEYEIKVVEPETEWKTNVDELAIRNTHGLTKSKIKDQLNNFAPIEVFCENILRNFFPDINFWINVTKSFRLKYFKHYFLSDYMEQTLQSPVHHPEGNVLNHTQLVFERLPSVWGLRSKEYDLSEDKHTYFNLKAACFLHDSGKVVTTWKRNGSENFSHYRHEYYSSKITEKVLNFKEVEKSDFYNLTGLSFNVKFISDLCLHHMLYCQLSSSGSISSSLKKWKEKYGITSEFFKYLLVLMECDTLGRGNTSGYDPEIFSNLWKEFNGN